MELQNRLINCFKENEFRTKRTSKGFSFFNLMLLTHYLDQKIFKNKKLIK